MDSYQRKLKEMQQYLSFLEEKIDKIKKIKAKVNHPDSESEKRLENLQKMYQIITNRDDKKKVNVATLEKIEMTIKKLKERDFLEKRGRSDVMRKDHNPMYNPELHRPSSSCSNVSTGSGSSSSFQHSATTNVNKKPFDDTPASPSPPSSPPPSHSTSTAAPIVIPTERESRESRKSRWLPIKSPPPLTLPGRFLLNRSPSPERKNKPKVVPITKVDVNEIGPLEWDTDDEDSSTSSSKRPEIIIPGAKGFNWKDDRKSDPILSMSKGFNSIHHPSDNIPTVQVNSLGGSRRLSTVIEKTNLLGDDSINRILTSHRPGPLPPAHPSPSMVPYPMDTGLHSPDPIIMGKSPPTQPFSSTPPLSSSLNPAAKRDATGAVPMTPSLLLSAPPSSSRLPIAIDDIAEYLDDNDKRRSTMASDPSKQIPRPTSRLLGSSPSMMSPRPDASPLHTDPRISSADPRSRPAPNDPRQASHLAHPSHVPINNDPRTHAGLPASVPRFADNYERHKRTQDPMPPQQQQPPVNDYGRQHQYGHENPHMVPPVPVHGIPGSGPGPGQYPMGGHNQVGYNNYQMGPGASPIDPYNSNMQSPQQQWNGPQHMQGSGSQSTYPMQQTQSWQNPNMYQNMQAGPRPLMSNNVGGITPGYATQPRLNATQQHMPPHVNNPNQAYNKYPSFPDLRPVYETQTYKQASSNDFQRPRPPWNNRSNSQYPRPGGTQAGWNKEGPCSGWNKEGQAGGWNKEGQSSGWNKEGSQSGWNKDVHSSGWNKEGHSSGWNKDGPPRPTNRDPRFNYDRDPKDRDSRDPRDPRDRDSRDPRDPRSRSTETNRPISPSKEVAKGPPPGKEVHPNKLKVMATAAEKEAAAKKRADMHHKLDLLKSKDKDKEKDKDKDKDKNKNKNKDKDKDKDKDKNKNKDKSKIKKPTVPALYGAIDIKKATQNAGTKFKIPKKRSSTDTRSEPSLAVEDIYDDDDEIKSSSTTHESSKKEKSESTTKTASKSSNKEKSKEKEKSKDKDKPKNKDKDDGEEEEKVADLLKKLLYKKENNLTKGDDETSILIKQLMMKLNSENSDEKKKKKNIYLSDDSSNSDEIPIRKPNTRKDKSKKSKHVISSDESDSNSDPKPVAKRPRKISNSKRLSQEDKAEETIEKKKESAKPKLKDTKVLKEVKVNLGEKKTLTQKINLAPINEKESDPPTETPSEIPAASESEKEVAAESAEASVADMTDQVNEIPAKRKPKRRTRELDALQEDLKSSWICDGAMRATGSRITTQKNASAAAEEEAKTAAAKIKKPRGKPGPKPKKPAVEPVEPIVLEGGSSESEDDDLPLSRRSDGPEAVKPKKAGKKGLKSSSTAFFEEESDDDNLNLDVSAVEPSSDISLHPEMSPNEKGRGKGQKSSKKATADAESSSDESYISNASSSFLDNSAKQRNNNEEVLEDVMSKLASNPKYTAAKKKQAKKKRSNWQMGILSKKKKKKVNNKVDENESLADTSASNEAESSIEKSLNHAESSDRLNDDESMQSDDFAINNDDIKSLVDPDALIGYTQTTNNDKQQCLLCPFYRKNIVHHYKIQHPKKEVLISRFSTTNADLAIEESKRLDFTNKSSVAIEKDVGRYSCRFCTFVTKGLDNCARESFYEHCTTHTGEYRFTCRTCKYESVTKNSIRAHYYKECKKHSQFETIQDAILETPIPEEDRIYGYLCCKCNYVQLKKTNVEKHIKLWHSKEGKDEVNIVKIDMSSNIKIEPRIKTENIEVPTKVEPKNEKDEKVPMETDEVPDIKDNITTKVGTIDESEIESEISVTLEITEHKIEKIEKPDVVEKNNLSAFVCASENEDKDVEIQNERKKKMHEIAQNIGINVNKDETQKRLSIIDKLKDKILDDAGSPEKAEDSEATALADDPLQTSEQEKESEQSVVESETVKIKTDPDAMETDENEDKTVKITDPLTLINEPTTQTSDDDVMSDNESSQAEPMQYDSDTEQSDQESPADVNSILQSSKEMSSPSKGHVMTTIQRLAAQLQNTKPLESELPPSEPERINADVPDAASVKIKKEKTSPKKQFEDMAVLSPTRITTEVKDEIKSEPTSPKTEEADDKSKQSTQSPKSFIRIRRISGDKLSKGGDQECNDSEVAPTSMATLEPIDSNNDETGFLKIANVVSLAPKDNDNQIVSIIRKAVDSPQKINNLSLLKKPSQFIIKRVDSNSVMTSTGEKLKLIPITLPSASRPMVKTSDSSIISIGGQQTVAIKIDSKGVAVPLTVTASGTATPQLVSSTNSPFKIIKIPSSSADHFQQVIKLKSANIYEKMLVDDKLVQMYKCMGRDCSFTTSSDASFNKHIRIHEDEFSRTDNSRSTEITTKDYLKCAYCYVDFKTYTDLMNHLKQNHIYCRFCCKYCFYRAFAYSYVEIHQKIFHPIPKIQILAVNEELVLCPPPPRRMDRKSIIKPYVCVHECNKYFFIPEAFTLHLNMHHTNIAKAFKCHICAVLSTTVDSLIEHYKRHGYFKFHCLYCVHGAASIKDLHTHLSTAHYNQPPHILERSLPREISKNLSAIDQLRIRDVDHLYKSQRNIIEEEQNSKVGFPPLMKITNSILQQTAPITTTKIIAPKDTTQFIPMSSIDGNIANIRIINPRSLKTPGATSTVLKPSSLQNIGKNIMVTLTDTSQSNNENSTLKNVDDNADSESVTINSHNQTELSSVKKKEADPIDDDSDIEFIEEVSNQSSDAVKSTPKTELFSQTSLLITPKKEKPAYETIEDQSFNTLEASNSNLSTPSSSSESVTSSKPSDSPNVTRFMTLDDIKDTGLTGSDLYVCGVEMCRLRYDTTEDLRLHMLQCSPSSDEIPEATLFCVHCGPSSKKFTKPSFFIDHLKTHGLKRFSCAICNARFAVQSQAQTHLRTKHKYATSKIVPADPMNPSHDGLFIVHPVSVHAKNKKSNKNSKNVEKEKIIYMPNEKDLLPMSAIYLRPMQCAVCPYSNKVRSNMYRHLQAHLKDESVPESSPVNPVPCLDKKEKMFDKMINLASSSHENGRMGGGGSMNNPNKETKIEEDEGLPKFVPENKRYVCGVAECNYLTVEEAMLRYHLKALHSDEAHFRCPHCPAPADPSQNIALEKMGVHLKMHDARLYKCSHCIYHHYHRHVVERHLTDKHPEARPYVKVIRELQPDQTSESMDQQQQSQSSSSSTPSNLQQQDGEEQDMPDPDGNNWKCNLCEFKSIYKSAVQQHCATVHDEKSQFKCNGCGFKAINKTTFDQHMATKHVNEPNVDSIQIYQKIRAFKKPDPEPGVPEEPFDTTPLWRRDMPRIRHIRGILLEEEEENNSEATKTSGKRKHESSEGKPAKIRTSKSSVDEGDSPEGKKARFSIDDIEKLRTADGGYGPYGKPVGELYVCTVCNQFRSRYKQDFRDHVYRDLKYTRWFCPSCDYKAVNRGAVSKHISCKHANTNIEPGVGEANEQIEEWVAMVVKSQSEIMRNTKILTSMTENDDEEIFSDDDDLVLDPKEGEEGESLDDVSSEMLPAPLKCKDCDSCFNKWRGFKRHVQLNHLRRLAYLCPYCDRSTNRETMMLQHVRSKHSDMPEKVLENPNPKKNELSADFWEREYGLVVPKRAKRKRKDDEDSRIEIEFPCDKCDFIGNTISSFKSHLKTHETKVKLKCSYCTYSSFNSTEMRQHHEYNHSKLDFKIEEAFLSNAAIEHNAKKSKPDDEKKATVYYCYYCEMGSTSLDAIRSHWKMIHQDDEKQSRFRYKEHAESVVKCYYCALSGTKTTLIDHIWAEHGKDKPILLVERDEEGWMCKWCLEEFFTTKEKIDIHHKQYHSHLRSTYKHMRRVFNCQQCQFETISLESMQRHAKTHLNSYMCKYCNEMFQSFALVKDHFKASHPDKEPESRTITSDDLSREIEKIVIRASVFSEVKLSPVKVSPKKTPPTSPRLAKKSTTKQTLSPVKPNPTKIRAVARKSTNPLPRYPKGLVFELEEETPKKYVSYYGRAPSPVDLAKFNTNITMGFMKVPINCAKLAELVNINVEPTLRIVDCQKEKVKNE